METKEDSRPIKKPKRHRQWLGRIYRDSGDKEKRKKGANREIRQNFWRHQVRNDIDSATRTPARKRRAKNRAASKRAKSSRKRNRV